MSRLLLAAALASGLAAAQVQNFRPVTEAELRNPSPSDWLMFSRTWDAQRFSPLDQINRSNVAQLKMAWVRGLGAGQTETIPIVRGGVMYVVAPGAIVQALDGATGDLLWEYKRNVPANVASQARTKSLAIYGDIIAYTAPDSFVVGLDARTGELRWETKVDTRGNTSGPLIAAGKVISGGACGGSRVNCYISAHDALTGKEAWRFYTTPAPGEPGDESWNGAPLDMRRASTWGIQGSYDPQRKLLLWGIANPMPDQRLQRHGSADGVSRTTPADLYSNSTVALDPETGKLVWYYQHLPGDDWDLDHTNERVLARVRFDPDPRFVKWINPNIRRGEERDVSVTIAEGGGLSVIDRATGEFLWATPFPFDSPNFAIADIDPKTGRATLNWDVVFKGEPGETHTVCYWNTKSYWPAAYSPQTNSLYTSYIDNCRRITAAGPGGRGGWSVVQRPGGNPNELTGMAKINLSTGEILRFDVGRAPGNGAVLATAGGLVFHGDMSRRFKAFDAETGRPLWESILGGNVSVSTITYAVNGKQYVAVMTGENLKVPELEAEVPELRTPRQHNAIYAFALP
jgi:PQQ-dependent dehydrogenase (methanol/ethanol family)